MIFSKWTKQNERFFNIEPISNTDNKNLTNKAFSTKWEQYSNEKDREQKKYLEFQKKWFLKLYGFKNETSLSKYLKKYEYILDAGCGLGYKSAWLASLAPKSIIIGIDYSSASQIAYHKYRDKYKNLIFAQGDIASTKLPDNKIGFVVCDQVIMHTDNPLLTLQEMSRITADKGEVCCYWYKKKALPRELLDDYFRSYTTKLTNKELWQLSKDVMALGKMLSKLKIKKKFPSIPSLGIVGGKMDLQRFIYWNFIKCFWSDELGYATSLSTNFDWYSPQNAKRFSKDEVFKDLKLAKLIKKTFHEEEACFSGRFVKQKKISK